MGLSLYWRSDENVRLIVDHGAQNFIGRLSRTLMHSSYVWAQNLSNVYGRIVIRT